MLTLAVVLVVVLAALVLAAWGWTRYRLAIYDAQHADELIAANRASPRPGMATPDPRFRERSARDRDMCC